MNSPCLRPLRMALLLGLLAPGCNRGKITFTLEAPPAAPFSPLADGRHDSMTLLDEATGGVLGTILRSDEQYGTRAISDLPVGKFRFKLTINGGAQLIGMARSQEVDVRSGVEQEIVLHLRKPIAFFGSRVVLEGSGETAGLMAFDTTLPPRGIEVALPMVYPEQASTRTTATTADGRFVLFSAGGQLAVVKTFDLSLVGKVAMPGGQVIRSIAISSDDRAAVVLTEQGAHLIGDLPGFLAMPDAAMLAPLTAPNARAAAFSSDQLSVAILLADQGWEELAASAQASWSSCAGAQGKSSVLIYVVSNPASAPPTQLSAPDGSTDIAYLGERLSVATPCTGSIRFVQDLQTAVSGRGVIDMAVAAAEAGDRLAIVQGSVDSLAIPFDPNKPRETNVTVPVASVVLVTGAGSDSSSITSNAFELPVNFLDFIGSDETQVQTSLSPTRIDAYDVSLSPDGTHVAMAMRLRYEAQGLRYVKEFDDPEVPGIYYYCDLNLKEDVYYVSEVDAASGTLLYQAVKGVADSDCSTQCFICNSTTCRGLTQQARTSCLVNRGVVPTGLAILMGAQ